MFAPRPSWQLYLSQQSEALYGPLLRDVAQSAMTFDKDSDFDDSLWVDFAGAIIANRAATVIDKLTYLLQVKKDRRLVVHPEHTYEAIESLFVKTRHYRAIAAGWELFDDKALGFLLTPPSGQTRVQRIFLVDSVGLFAGLPEHVRKALLSLTRSAGAPGAQLRFIETPRAGFFAITTRFSPRPVRARPSNRSPCAASTTRGRSASWTTAPNSRTSCSAR